MNERPKRVSMPVETLSGQESTLEELYKILFRLKYFLPIEEIEEEHSLAQPSPYKTVRTITTYGAYEDPI